MAFTAGTCTSSYPFFCALQLFDGSSHDLLLIRWDACENCSVSRSRFLSALPVIDEALSWAANDNSDSSASCGPAPPDNPLSEF